MAIDGVKTTQVLDRDFGVFDTARQGDPSKADGKISQEDLQAVADNVDNKFTPEQQQAAKDVLGSLAVRSFLDVGAGKGEVDGTIGRGDVTGAMESIKNGNYTSELLDTAAGRGRSDGFASKDDVIAALNDPGVPQQVKDTLQLARTGDPGELNDLIKGLKEDGYKAGSELYNSAEFKALSPEDKKLAAEVFRDAKGDAATTNDLLKQIKDPSFQALTAPQKSAKLEEFALTHSAEFKALPAADQKNITDALAGRKSTDTALPKALHDLIEDKKFSELSAGDKTAVLSQAKNYPDSRSVSNMERTLQKEWFQDQDGGDKQRSLKLVAHLSQHDSGDRAIIDNTLNRFLSPDSDYELDWKAIPDEGGNTTYGYADDETLTLNANKVPADNNRVSGSDAEAVIENTTAHEVSHLVNGDETNQTFDYLNEEYRAWYVGYMAENGKPPSNEEAADRWEYFLNPSGGYADYAHGIQRDWWWDTDGALDKPEEAAKIFDTLSQLTGLKVDASNYQSVLSDTSKWKTKPSDPAASVPPGDRDN